MKTTILGTRQLPLPRVPTATLKGFLMVYQHKNIKHGHLKIITMIRKNDKDIKKMAIILPTGQWYAPSAVINDAWYCMVLHCIA